MDILGTPFTPAEVEARDKIRKVMCVGHDRRHGRGVKAPAEYVDPNHFLSGPVCSDCFDRLHVCTGCGCQHKLEEAPFGILKFDRPTVATVAEVRDDLRKAAQLTEAERGGR